MTDKRQELPLCASRYIDAVAAVRGEGAVLQLLTTSLNLRASARLLYVAEVNCYFLKLDTADRWENPRVGTTEAMSTLPFKAANILKTEIKSWSVLDYAHITDPTALQALVDLSVINYENVDFCTAEAFAVLKRRNLHT
ncbi:hypothetical protein [Pseudomonas syringae]|uniref:hypothetical protein n=1 Tax=Pseudomonas syringae TaxID=317 RepID=UPI00067E0E2C|nr:hypothetical protein [Pseudomonas syringae]